MLQWDLKTAFKIFHLYHILAKKSVYLLIAQVHDTTFAYASNSWIFYALLFLWPSKVLVYIASWFPEFICRLNLSDKFHLRFKFDISLRCHGVSDLCQFCPSKEVIGSTVPVVSRLQGQCLLVAGKGTGTKYFRAVQGEEWFAPGHVAGQAFHKCECFRGIQASTAHLCCPWKEEKLGECSQSEVP